MKTNSTEIKTAKQPSLSSQSNPSTLPTGAVDEIVNEIVNLNPEHGGAAQDGTSQAGMVGGIPTLSRVAAGNLPGAILPCSDSALTPESINPNPGQGGTGLAGMGDPPVAAGNLPGAGPGSSESVLDRSKVANQNSKIPDPFLKDGRGHPSKVGRLPQALRDWLNECLLRNIPGHIIVEELEEKGFPGFNVMNISSWRNGGFKHWLKDQESAAEQQARRDLALAYARESGCSLAQALCQASLDNLYQLACKLDINLVLTKIEKDPELFLKMNKGLVSLLKVDKELNSRGAHKLINKEIPPGQTALWPRRKGGLTLEERDAAEKRMRLFE